MKRAIASVLVLQMIAPMPSFASSIRIESLPSVSSPSASGIAAAGSAFADLLREYRVRLDSERGSKEELITSFAESLIDRGIGVEEVDAYVKSQLTAKEYQAYQKDLSLSMKGLDPESLTSSEFSQIVSRALNETQAKGLTYSSCAVRTTGIVLAVASVVVGLVALLKKKLDKVTEQGLYNAYMNKRNQIQSQYANEKSFLNDPQGHYERAINQTYGQIDRSNREIGEHLDSIAYRQEQIAHIQYELYYYTDLSESEIASMQREISMHQSSISSHEYEIDELKKDIYAYQNNIHTYRKEQQRYSDPRVVANERKQLEAWYQEALNNAEKDYQVSLKNMPSTNVDIAEKNEKIAKTKKTLGIIAGAGGAASLGLILSSRDAQYCY